MLHADNVDGEFVVRRDDCRPGDRPVLPPAFQELPLQQQGTVGDVGDDQGADLGGGFLADLRGPDRGVVIARDLDLSPYGDDTERTAGRTAFYVKVLHADPLIALKVKANIK